MNNEKNQLSNHINISEEPQEWCRFIFMIVIVMGLVLLASHAYASDGTEFQAAADKFESWIQGNLGKLAAFIALAVGAIVAAIKKDWTWFMGAVVLSMGMGILLGIVNSSFTATI